MFGTDFGVGFGVEWRSDSASIEARARTWWPFVALALGILLIVLGAISFSP